MAAVGSRDGREIVLALDALRQERSRSRQRGTLFHQPNSAVTRKGEQEGERRMSVVLQRSLLACLATLGAVARAALQARRR